jgi:hypothetical protein
MSTASDLSEDDRPIGAASGPNGHIRTNGNGHVQRELSSMSADEDMPLVSYFTGNVSRGS